MAPVHTLIAKLWLNLAKWMILTQNYVFWERFFKTFEGKHEGLPISGHHDGQNSYKKSKNLLKKFPSGKIYVKNFKIWAIQ
jgi:superfamily II DNA or RNA helicase